MTAHIAINISHGNASVKPDDIARAEKAALDYFAAEGVDPVAAQIEYRRQMDEESDYTGIAATFAEAEAAADLALTAGWHDTNGAFCEIEVWETR